METQICTREMVGKYINKKGEKEREREREREKNGERGEWFCGYRLPLKELVFVDAEKKLPWPFCRPFFFFSRKIHK